MPPKGRGRHAKHWECRSVITSCLSKTASAMPVGISVMPHRLPRARARDAVMNPRGKGEVSNLPRSLVLLKGSCASSARQLRKTKKMPGYKRRTSDSRQRRRRQPKLPVPRLTPLTLPRQMQQAQATMTRPAVLMPSAKKFSGSQASRWPQKP